MRGERTIGRGVQLITALLLIVPLLGCGVIGQNTATSNAAAQATVVATEAVATPPATTAVQATPASTATVVAETPAAGATAPAVAASMLTTAVRDVVKEVRPAVVQVTNQQVQVNRFNQTFTIPAGVGSGVIYDAQGHILTNNHVVEGAENLLVSLPDGRTFPANLVGADPLTDLAVIQITGDNLPVAEIGDSGQLQVGDWVVAIGNALALPGGPTVTVGVVGALDRAIEQPTGAQQGGATGPFLFGLIQTDAAINPGNSGGPLINLQGQVVGINTLGSQDAQNIGFAISTGIAKPIADELVANGRVLHSYLGINYLPMNPVIAAQLGIDVTQGLIITQVASGSPAEQAGLQEQDIIVVIDGQPVTEDSALARALSQRKPGDTLRLTIQRDGQQSDIQATLTERPSS